MTSFVLFFSSHYAVITVIALIAFGLGRRLMGAKSFASVLEEVSFSTAAGLGVIAYFILALALLHILYRSVVLSLLLIAAALAMRPLLDLIRQLRQSWQALNHRWLFGAVFGLSLIAFLPALVLPLYPPSTWDALMYHLPVAKLDVQAHSLVFSPYIRFPAFPETVEMLFSLMLLVSDDISAQLIHFLMMLLIAATLFAWGQRIYSSKAGLWAAVIWLSNPFVLFFGSVAYIDMGVALYVCLGAYAFSNWLQTRCDRWLVISGIEFGLGAACKYSALAPLFAFVVILFFMSIRRRESRALSVFIITVGLVAAPWYLRNLYYTGNPVWPYFGSLFGTRPWSASDLQGLLHNQRTDYSQGRSIVLLLKLPWNLSFRMLQVFRQEAPVTLSPAYFLCLPLVVVYAIRSRYTRALLAGLCLFTLFWFDSIQIVRFLLPGVAILGLIAMTALAYFTDQWQANRLVREPLLSVVVALLLFVPGWRFSIASWRRQPLPITAADRDAYLRKALPPYPAYEWLNRRFAGSYVIYAPGDQKMTYYADGHFMGDWFGPAGCMQVIKKLSDSRALYQQLLDFKADFFLLNENDFRPAVFHGLPWLDDDFSRTHFRLVWAAPHIQLFEVVRSEVKPISTPELIRDPSFEEVRSEWTFVEQSSIDRSGAHSHSGATAIEVTQANRAWQRVQVSPCHVYRLSQWTAASAPGRKSRLQVNWLSDTGPPLSDLEIVDSSPAWVRHEMFATAPQNAHSAEIYLGAQVGSVWVDDVSLTEQKYLEGGASRLSGTSASPRDWPCR